MRLSTKGSTRRKMKLKALLSAVLGCALVWPVSAAAAQKEIELKSGEEHVEEDEIALTQPTKVGDITLQPDTYVLQHHLSGGQHFIRFMQVRKSRELLLTRTYTGWYTHTKLNKVAEINCRMEPLGAKVQATTVTIATENGTPRITQVMIKGKAAACAFQAEMEEKLLEDKSMHRVWGRTGQSPERD